MRARTKTMAIIVAAALLVIIFVGGLIWKMVQIDRCYDNGGIVVGPLMRDQECVMPNE